jgi:hypothetical protein
LTTDKVLQALAAMGTPVVMVDEPTAEDLPILLGCLLASTEAALHQAEPEALKLVADGYRGQISGPESGFVQALGDRINVLAMQLEDHPVPVGENTGALDAAAEAAMTSNAMLAVHVLSLPDSTGKRAEPAMLREVLREAKRFLGNTRRRFEHVLQMMRRRGINL